MEASHRARNYHELHGATITHIENYLATRNKEEPKEPDHLGLRVIFHPSETLIDLVFVHGLWNGPTKTWSHQDHPAYFWPKQWLARDPGFRNVRVSSYGYNTEPADRHNNRFEIVGLGEQLLTDLSESKDIRSPGNTSIILIGHSIGGVIIKKTVMSQKDQRYADLAKRIRALFFLATPHKEAGSWMEKQFAKALQPRDLEDLHVITEEFKRQMMARAGIQLWSFYESLQEDSGTKNAGIVLTERLSSIGLPDENLVRMEANHLQICQFDKPSNPNYLALRNALVKVIDETLEDVLANKREEYRKNMSSLKTFLKITEGPDDDLSNQETLRLEGSCEWLTEKPDFSMWKENRHSQNSRKLFWLQGMPATGKSVLAAHVVNHLESLNYDCAYHFFKNGNSSTSSVSAMLRSLAYQMAGKNIEVREKLLELQQNESQISIENSRILWQRLFSQAILRADFHQPQFWVLDALDECEDHESLYRHLEEINKEKNSPFRLFMTSRPTPQLRDFFVNKLKGRLHQEMVSKEDTTGDIRRFFVSNQGQLPAEGPQDQSILIDELVQKSQGCFLWARAILEDLKDAYSDRDIQSTIRSLPNAMGPLYERTLNIMSEHTKTKPLSKAILTWTICATRVLSVDELKAALECDKTLSGSEEKKFKAIRLQDAIVRSCSHLLYVDTAGKIQIMHQTAREFLLQGDLKSEFAIHEEQGHTRLAWSCLKYLTSDEMKPPAYQGRQSIPTSERSNFVNYACTSFSDHLVKSNSEDTQILQLLATFLRSNVLSWIDVISQGQDLSHLIRVAKNLKTYVDQRTGEKESSQLISEWSTDLIRLVARFGRNLMTSPSSIYFLIPPLCPKRSAIYKAFGSRSQGICVEGLSSDIWDDRLSCITYPQDQANAIASRGSHFAVGLQGGEVVLYDTSSCQEIRRFTHGENVTLLQFSHNASILVSSGARKVKAWVPKTGEQLWQINMANSPLALGFSENDKILLVATRTNHVATYKTTDGSEESPMYALIDLRRGHVEPGRAPAHAVFSAGLEVLAVEYRGGTVSLWDLQSKSWLTFCKKSGTRPGDTVGLTTLLFNPEKDLKILVVSDLDGDLVLFGIDDPKQKAIAHKIDAQALASSPDGRTLACWSSSSVIRIFDFVTLTELYSLQCDSDVKGLAFASDGLRFFDIQEDRCNVWEPSVLVRKDSKESIETKVADTSKKEDHSRWNIKSLHEDDPIITTLVLDSEKKRIICGIANGNVSLFDSETGLPKSLLYRQRINVAISAIEAEGQQKIASLDIAGRIQVHSITQTSSGKWSVRGQSQDKTMSEKVSQIILCGKGERLLVVLAHTSQLWDVSSGLTLVKEHGTSSPSQRIWFKSIKIRDGLYCLDQSGILLFDGYSLDKMTIPDNSSMKMYRGFSSIFEVGKDYLLRLAFDLLRSLLSLGESEPHESHVIESVLYEEEDSLLLSHSFLWLLSKTEQVIGIQSTCSRVIFLDIDYWVCAADLYGIRNHQYERHFIVPFNWMSSKDHIPFQISEDGIVYIGKGEEVVVVRQGLDFGETITH